jgi:hypothetical protein
VYKRITESSVKNQTLYLLYPGQKLDGSPLGFFVEDTLIGGMRDIVAVEEGARFIKQPKCGGD